MPAGPLACVADRQNGPCHSGRLVTWRRSQEGEGGRRAQMEVTLQSGMLDYNAHVMLRCCTELVLYPNIMKFNRRCLCDAIASNII